MKCYLNFLTLQHLILPNTIIMHPLKSHYPTTLSSVWKKISKSVRQSTELEVLPALTLRVTQDDLVAVLLFSESISFLLLSYILNRQGSQMTECLAVKVLLYIIKTAVAEFQIHD